MKNIITFLLCALLATESLAGIRSLGGQGADVSSKSKNNNAKINDMSSVPVVNIEGRNTAVICKNSGFTLQECPNGYAPVYACPQNNKYFRDCCPQEYRFTANYCYEQGLEPSLETCLGFHACRVKKQEKAAPPAPEE